MGATVPQGDIGLTLALAVFAASNAPILLLDGNQTIVAASDCFCPAFDVSATGIAGKSLYDLDGMNWDVPRLCAFMGATISGLADVDAYALNIATHRPAVPVGLSSRCKSWNTATATTNGS